MMTFLARRLLAGTLTAVTALALVVVLVFYSSTLHSAAYLTGWILLAVMLFLTSYNVRKKLTYPPLFTSSTWLQLHIYVGLLSVLVFLFHTRLRLPNGALEITLFVLYAIVALSGVIGLFLTRLVPSRLADRGEEVLFERIPIYRREVRERAEELVVESVEKSNAMTVADFYSQRLASFFAGPRNYWRHLLQSRRQRNELIRDLQSLRRYLNDDEDEITTELLDLVEAKDALDYHRAMQGTLKGWLFVHVPLTYALLVFVALHVVLVYAFHGGVR